MQISALTQTTAPDMTFQMGGDATTLWQDKPHCWVVATSHHSMLLLQTGSAQSISSTWLCARINVSGAKAWLVE